MEDHEQARAHPASPPPHSMAEEEEKKLHHHKGTTGGGGVSPSYRYGYAVKDRRRAVSTFIVILLVLVGITALIVWLLYRPHKPKFRVVGAAVYDMNTTSPPYLSTTMQFTLLMRNPNRRVSIFYDQLSAFVTYRNQPITPSIALPPLRHETKSTVALSPVLGGSPMPVAAEVVNGLLMEEGYGAVGLRLVLTGRVKYKGGVVNSRRSKLDVRCDLFVGLRRGVVGQLPLLGAPPCRVDVS